MHHVPALFNLNTSQDQSTTSTCKINITRNYYKANYKIINNNIMGLDWSSALSDSNINANLQNFYKSLQPIIESHVPFKKAIINHFPVWYDSKLRQKVLEEKKMHILWKTTLFLSHHIAFKKLREECIRLSRTKYLGYLSKVESSIQNNSRFFWSYIRDTKRTKTFPSNTYLNHIHANSESETANLFSTYFGSCLGSRTGRRVKKKEQVNLNLRCFILVDTYPPSTTDPLPAVRIFQFF